VKLSEESSIFSVIKYSGQ